MTDIYAPGTWHIEPDGTMTAVSPKNGTDFSLEELNEFVGGYIEIVSTTDGRIMVLNEEGKLNGLPVNLAATILYGNPNDVIVGDVLVCPPEQIK